MRTFSLSEKQITCPICGEKIDWHQIRTEICELNYVDSDGNVEASQGGQVSYTEEFVCSSKFCHGRWDAEDFIDAWQQANKAGT